MNIEQNFWEHYDFTEYNPPNNEISDSIFEWQNNTYAERLNKFLENNKIDDNNNYYVVEINKYNVKGYYNLKYIKLYFSIIRIEKKNTCYLNYYIDTPFKKYSFKMCYPRMLACLKAIQHLFFYNIEYFYLYIKNSYEIAQKHNLKCVIKPQSDNSECLDKHLSIRFYYTKEDYVLFRGTFTQPNYYFDLSNFIPSELYDDYDEKKHISTDELLIRLKSYDTNFSLYDYIKYHDRENFREIDEDDAEENKSEEADEDIAEEDGSEDTESEYAEDFTFEIDDVEEAEEEDSEDGESEEDTESEDGESEDGESEDGETEDGESEEDETEDGESEEGESEEDETEDGESEDGESEDSESKESKKPNYHNIEEGNYHELEPYFDPVIFTYVSSNTSISTKKYLIKENKYNSDYFEDVSIQTFMCIPHHFNDLINKMEKIVMNEIISHYSKQFDKSKDFQIFSNIIDFL